MQWVARAQEYTSPFTPKSADLISTRQIVGVDRLCDGGQFQSEVDDLENRQLARPGQTLFAFEL